MKQLLRSGAIAMLVIAAASCEGAPEDCPEVDTAELMCPAEIGPFEISACGGVPDGPSPPVGIDAVVDGDVLRITLAGVLFRDDNVICGFAERSGGEIAVLLQPCTLVPEGGVSKGDCWYETVAFDVDEVAVAGATQVTVFHRTDSDASLPPDAPREIASATLP